MGKEPKSLTTVRLQTQGREFIWQFIKDQRGGLGKKEKKI